MKSFLRRSGIGPLALVTMAGLGFFVLMPHTAPAALAAAHEITSHRAVCSVCALPLYGRSWPDVDSRPQPTRRDGLRPSTRGAFQCFPPFKSDRELLLELGHAALRSAQSQRHLACKTRVRPSPRATLESPTRAARCAQGEIPARAVP